MAREHGDGEGLGKPVGPTGTKGKCPVCKLEFAVRGGIIVPHVPLGKTQQCLGAGRAPFEPKTRAVPDPTKQGSLF